jgi:photosystem II stability/assembly factor-like uncharacterized protein
MAGLASLGLSCGPGRAPSGTAPHLVPLLIQQASGISRRLQAVSAPSDLVAWVSGAAGTYAITTDGGVTWRAGVVPGADSLEFRDVHAMDSANAYLLSAGPGDRSRIYRTHDGGRTWTLQFINPDSEGFFDCFAFWDERTGVAFSDNVNGAFPLYRTADGSRWDRIPEANVPPATQGEGGFAASGTCVLAFGPRQGWITTGAGALTRVLRTRDRGQTWVAFDTPVIHGSPTTGLTTVTFRDEWHGLAAGGDIAVPDQFTDNIAITDDGGSHWRLAGRPPFPGAVYGAAYVPGSGRTLVAVGPRGAAWSRDDGWTWAIVDTLGWWSVAFASARAGWLVGPEGRIAKVGFSAEGGER